MKRIMMTTPLVEMDGDEMTRVLWKMIKEKLLLPFVNLKTEYYDLGLVVEGIKPFIPTWTKPITIARHAYGDVYKNTELRVEKGSTAQLRVIDKDWNETCSVVCNKGHDIKKVRSSF